MLVLYRPAIWLFTAVHVGFLYSHVYHHLDLGSLVVDEDNATAITTALLVFFSVFFGGLCYARYFAFHDACMGMYSCCVQYAGLVRLYLPGATPQQHWNACRHMMASAYMLYFELGGDASMGGTTVDDAEWGILYRLQLLDPAERDVLESYAGPRPQLLQNWAIESMTQLLATAPKVEGASLAPFEEQALALRGHCGAITNQLKQPVPYPLYTTLMFMLCTNLLVLAYAMSGGGSIWSIPVYFMTCLVLLGLKELSCGLSDPFGNDAVDFDVDAFMARIMLNVRALLSPQADYVPQKLECPPLDS